MMVNHGKVNPLVSHRRKRRLDVAMCLHRRTRVRKFPREGLPNYRIIC